MYQRKPILICFATAEHRTLSLSLIHNTNARSSKKKETKTFYCLLLSLLPHLYYLLEKVLRSHCHLVFDSYLSVDGNAIFNGNSTFGDFYCFKNSEVN